MRYGFRLGFAFVLGLALMTGCSDENGEGGSAGAGGSAGMGGAAGSAGSAGMGGAAGSGGSAINETAGCANATLSLNGTELGTAALNYANNCVSGQLGDLPLTLLGPGIPVVLNNTALVVTVDQEQGFDGFVASTLSGDIAVALTVAINPDAGPVVALVFDILETLATDTEAVCDSISNTLEVGGVVLGANQ